MEIEAGLLELYKDPSLDTKPKLLEERGGAFYSDAAAALIASLHAGTGDVQVVNVRNDGAIPNLPDDAVVEVSCTIDRDGAHPLSVDAVAARDARARRAREGLRAADDRRGAVGIAERSPSRR